LGDKFAIAVGQKIKTITKNPLSNICKATKILESLYFAWEKLLFIPLLIK
jgi:hypothetical protein